MSFIYATYNTYHNYIDIITFGGYGYIIRIDCRKAKEGLKTTPCSECDLNALTIDESLDIYNPSGF